MPPTNVTPTRSACSYLEAELGAMRRRPGSVSYDLLVRLKDNAPVGYFRDRLVLDVRAGRQTQVYLDVEGHVVPAVSVRPQPLVLDEVVRGDQKTKKLVVSGKAPFKITGFECENDSVSFRAASESKKHHVVDMTYSAEREPGNVKQAFHICTDFGNQIKAKAVAYATVVAETEPAAAVDDTVEQIALKNRSADE